MVSAITFFVMGSFLYTSDSAFMKTVGIITAFISYFCMHKAWNSRNKKGGSE